LFRENRGIPAHDLIFNWWYYKDAGSFEGVFDLKNVSSNKVSFTAPKVNQAETIHIILEVSDNGSPSLKGYQRIIVKVNP